jgi:hypothetical protein
VFLSGGGTVIADVGRLVFDAEGDIIFKAGPHPALPGDFPALRRNQPSSVLTAESIDVPSACLPCHSCAISQGQSRYRADNHGHCHVADDFVA